MNNIIYYKDFIKENNEESEEVDIPFYNNNKSYEWDETDIIQNHHKDFIEKTPELKMFSLESDYIKDTNEYVWFYSLNNNFEDFTIDLFLEIRTKKYWSIDFELNQICDDDEYVKTNIDNAYIQEEKHFQKEGLSYKELLSNLKYLSDLLNKWNQEFYEKWEFYPLVD